MSPIIVPLTALLTSGGTGIAIHRGSLTAPIRDDGLAEAAVHDASRTVYDDPRRFGTAMVTVKEEMDRARGVKEDPPCEGRDLLTVLETMNGGCS